MLNAFSSRLGFTTAPLLISTTEPSTESNLVEEEEEDDPNLNEPPQFPLPNSIQRAKSASSSNIPPPPSFSFDSPPVSDNEEEEDDEDETSRRIVDKEGLSTTQTKVAKKRVKVFVEPGFSQLHWAKLKSSGANLRGNVTELQRITPKMLAQHKSKEDCWQAYHGKVYNVTPFMKYHPGGIPELMRASGRDGTELFMKTHAWVNAEYMMGEGTLVGYLVREE